MGGGWGGVGGVGGEALGGDAELLVEGHLVAGRRARAAALERGVVDVEPGEERAHDLVLPAVLAAGPPHRRQPARPPSCALTRPGEGGRGDGEEISESRRGGAEKGGFFGVSGPGRGARGQRDRAASGIRIGWGEISAGRGPGTEEEEGKSGGGGRKGEVVSALLW